VSKSTPKAADLRIFWSDVDGIHNLTGEHHRHDLVDGVYALVGPIENHMAEPELQDALCIVAIRRNRRFGRLSFGRFVALYRDYMKRGERYVR
jgi:hypothetical protein